MIEVKNLSLRLAGRRVLSNISFRIEAGDIWAVIGAPEAGKSVLLKALGGLLPLESGTLEYDGLPQVLHEEGWQHHLGMSFQHDALFDAMTVFENVAFPLRRRGIEAVEDAVMLRLEAVGLAESRSRFPVELSGGMRKRVGIARATVYLPRLGLFDEPTAGLDPVTSAQIVDLLGGFVAEGRRAAIIVSSDISTILPAATHVLFLLRGTVKFLGTRVAALASPDPELREFIDGQGFPG